MLLMKIDQVVIATNIGFKGFIGFSSKWQIRHVDQVGESIAQI